MQSIKNFCVGFLLSFLGSIPLGYLNIVGFQLFQQSGWHQTILFLMGVIIIEAIIIFATLIFANKIATNKKLSKILQVFSMLFLFLLAFVFYFGSNSKTYSLPTFHYPPLILGMVLSALNFVHIPFWTGWNIYLINEKYIEITKTRKHFYVIGALFGTFSGMLTLILSLTYFVMKVNFLSKDILSTSFALLFMFLGCYKGYVVYKAGLK